MVFKKMLIKKHIYEWEELFTKRPPDTAKPHRQQHGDGTEPNPSLNSRELDEWEHLFGRDEDL